MARSLIHEAKLNDVTIVCYADKSKCYSPILFSFECASELEPVAVNPTHPAGYTCFIHI